MSNFCTKCGNPIEFCTCQKTGTSAQMSGICPDCGLPVEFCTCVKKAPSPRPAPSPVTGADNSFCPRCGRPKSQCICRRQPGPAGNGSFCTKCGNPREYCTCGMEKQGIGNRIRDYFGFNVSDKKFKDNSLEEGKNIVPVIIDPSKEEKFIKQYDIGRMRRRLTFSLGYSRILVTNKRVIMRSVNKSVFGKDVSHEECAIDEILGIGYERGKSFSLADFFLLFIVGIIPYALCALIGSINIIFAGIMSFIALFGFIALKFLYRTNNKKLANFISYIICIAGAGFGAGGLGGDAYGNALRYVFYGYGQVTFCAIPAVLCSLLSLIFLIKCSFLPTVSISIKAKVLSDGGMEIGFSGSHKFRNILNKMMVLPADNTESAIKELGAIINDVQKFGDYAVEKWAKK